MEVAYKLCGSAFRNTVRSKKFLLHKTKLKYLIVTGVNFARKEKWGIDSTVFVLFKTGSGS
jgi:hypothetical protein